MEPNATVICLSYGLITDWALLHVASMDHFNILELVTTQQRYSNILTSVILPLVETPNEPHKGAPIIDCRDSVVL